MAAKLLLALFACLAVGSGALVRRDAPAPPSVLQDMQRHAAEMQKTLGDQYSKLASSKNTQDFNKAVKEGTDSVLHQLQELSKSLQAAITDANDKGRAALEQTRKNLERTAEELRKAHPDVEKQATALRDKLQAAVQNTVKESEKLAKEVAATMEQTNQKLAPKIKAAYDDFVKHAEEVQKKLNEAATKH